MDLALLQGLADAEETLRQGSKSFEVAKLAFGREMRIGLVAVYAWCRVTVRGFSFWSRGRRASTEGEDSGDLNCMWNQSGQHRARGEAVVLRCALEGRYAPTSMSL